MIFSLYKRAYLRYTQQKWNIGFIRESIDDIVTDKAITIQICNHSYKDSWFADPFILEVTESKIYLLVEELYSKLGRGRISRLTVDRITNCITKVEPLIQLDSHLSFPAIRRAGDDIFIYPENGRGLGLATYKYSFKNNKCRFIKIISSKPLADAIITDVLGKEEMYATEIPTHNGNVLNRYSIEENEIVMNAQFCFSSNIARNAGDWFMHDGKVYRPAQDCNECYGAAVILQEVVKNNDNLKFHDVRRIKSTSWKYITGLHTLNHYKGITVIDVHGYRYPILGWLFKTLTPKWFLK